MPEKVKIITKREFAKHARSSDGKWHCTKPKWWQQLFIEITQYNPLEDRYEYFTCAFTPWRLFATFHVPSSKYFKARVEY